MKGFQDKFADLPDYILKITKEIWEDRGVATLHHYYAPDIPMRTPAGLVRGNRAVIDGTLATLAEVPDRQLLEEDVIWSGDEDAGFLSSHRLATMGTHTGHGYFGPPTGRHFTIRVIADCAAKDDVIYDEWLVRDAGGIVRQLGMDPERFARDVIAREGGPEKASRPLTPAADVPGGYRSRGNDDEWGQRLADILTRIMEKDFAVIRSEYDPAVRTEHPGAQGGWSWDFPETQWMRLRSSLVLLPGMMCDGRLFGPQIGPLSRRAGLFLAPIGGHDTMAALAAEVLAHAPPRFALAGLSMGGIVAMEVLRQAPDRVERIALLDTNPLAEPEVVRARREPQIGRAMAGDLRAVMRDEMMPYYLAAGAAGDALLDLCLEMALDFGPEVFARQSRALAGRPDQTGTLCAFRGPALVLTGAEDRLCPRDRHDLMHALMPRSRLVVIKGAGHLPCLEKPTETTAELLRWLEE